MNHGLRRLLDLVLIIASFSLMTDLPWDLWEWNGSLSLGFLFWVGMYLGNPGHRKQDLTHKVLMGTGLVFLFEATLSYVQDYPTHSIPSILMSSALALTLLAVERYMFLPPASVGGGVLLIGFDSAVAQFVSARRLSIDGIYDKEPAPVVASGIPYLGLPPVSASALVQVRPREVVVTSPSTLTLAPEELVRLRFVGIHVSSLSQFYEAQLRRVYYRRMDPLDFVLPGSFRTNPFAMALQSVYNNLIGLILLLTVLPLLLALAILVALSGPGPVFEIIECAGLQQVPFHRLHFRTRRGDTGEATSIGRFMLRFKLDPLPQLINLVRGEMALFGPSPMRMEFADYIGQHFPFYFHRFAVRPGIFGWAKVSLAEKFTETPECVRLEYDLYYVRHVSVALDFEVLWRTTAQWLRSHWKR